MALAGRSSRRGPRGARWIAVGLVATLLILLIDASLHSTSTKTTQSLAAGVWVDQVLPVIAASNQQGQVIAAMWANGTKMTASSISSQLDEAATGASQAYQQVVKLKPPSELDGPAGLLEACLLSRSQAASSLKKSMDSFLLATARSAPPPTATAVPGAATTTTTVATTTTTTTVSGTSPSPPSATVNSPPVPPLVSTTAAALPAVVNEIQVGDSAYRLFRSSVKESMPPSVWLGDASPYGAQNADIFLATLQNAISTTQINEIRIFSLSTTPSPVTVANGVQILPDNPELWVTFVVADTGNQPATGLTATASISPSGGGTTSVRDFVDLQAGQFHTLQQLGPLKPPKGVPVTLTVQVTSSPTSTAPLAVRTLVFQMPTPPPPSTTTTTTLGAKATTSTSS